jgi:diacylglycerol kinase family enzyme
MSALDLATLRIGAILNTSSGSCTKESEARMREIFEEAGVGSARLWCTAADGVENSFSEAEAHGLDLLIVLGGDGTIRSAAARARADQSLLMPLPGGTMNMLPKALYGDRTWEDALRLTLAKPQIRAISGGAVNDQPFYIASIIGGPALWAEAREAVREGAIVDAAGKGLNALTNMFGTSLTYRMDEGDEGSCEAISVICPLISTELDNDDAALEAALVEAGSAGAVLEIASVAAFGQWRDSQNITLAKTQRIQVRSDGPIPVIVDGESIDAGNSLEVTFVPKAFRALVPAQP